MVVERVQTPDQTSSIRLIFREMSLRTIENPYATYAEGGIVGDAEYVLRA